MPNPESKVCLYIDDPRQETLTTFSKVEPFEKPQKTRPLGIADDAELLSVDIYMPGQIMKSVLQDINDQWIDRRDALYIQYLGGETQTALILGYTIRRKAEGGKLGHVRIYTA